jgi:hypothetical protein
MEVIIESPEIENEDNHVIVEEFEEIGINDENSVIVFKENDTITYKNAKISWVEK